MTLKLSKPLAVFDLETTGTIPATDRIVSIGIIRLSPDGLSDLSKEYLVNPGIPIPSEASAVHKITDEMVRDKPSFKDIASELLGVFEGCDLAGFNIEKFDLPLLSQEFARVGIPNFASGRRIVDSMVIFHKNEHRDLTAAVRFYLDRDHSMAHSALADAQATSDVLSAQINRYGLPSDVEGLHKYCAERPANYIDSEGKLVWKDGKALFSFGKLKGFSLEDAITQNKEYLDWILNSDFPSDCKEIIRQALNGKFPEPL